MAMDMQMDFNGNYYCKKAIECLEDPLFYISGPLHGFSEQ
jgi:hypothetical protein